MNLTLPTDLSSKSRSRLRRMDPRTLDTSRLKQSISLPRVDMPHVDMPHVDIPHMDVPHVQFPQMKALDDAGKAAASFAGDAGKAAASGMADAGRAMGSLFETAGERLHDLRMSVAPPPKRTSVAQRGMVALAIASIVGSVAAAAAFFLHPVRGAARRAALRRRLGSGAREARTGVDTALVAARRATGRATVLVRIPIESARDVVGSRNGHADSEAADAADAADADAASVLVAAGSAAESHATQPSTTDSGAPEIDAWVAATAANHDGTNGSHAEAAKGAEAETEAVGE